MHFKNQPRKKEEKQNAITEVITLLRLMTCWRHSDRPPVAIAPSKIYFIVFVKKIDKNDPKYDLPTKKKINKR